MVEPILDFSDLLRDAGKFHGHRGPFLAIGVRMGIIGMRKLGVKGNKKGLSVTVTLKYSVPISCIIDGIQVVTHCTVGNKKLSIKRGSSEIEARFKLQKDGQVKVMVNQAALNNLKNMLLAEESSPEEVQRLVEMIASMAEDELFLIENK